ncbi:carcinine transporter [Ischnura elegans]|uniref:carcinine transporter n=1 Tax=Ischnura elegans TaxID=197161 RepID=UPI001ED87DBE|nr:carcinine transporter [Ischnura elegans]
MDSGISERLLMEDGKALPPSGAATAEDRDAFDNLLEDAGSHGKFQIRFNVIFNFSLSAIVSMSFLNYVMAMTVPDHWCHVPGATGANISADRWKELTLPREPDTKGEMAYSKCKMFNVTAEDIIMEQFFNQPVIHKEIIGCQYGWEYDKTWYLSTTPSDNDWVCENELRVTNIFMYSRIGDVVGAFVFGQLGDQIGRRKVFIAGIALLVVGRAAAVLCASIYPLFAICIFFSNSSLLAVFQSPLAIGTEFCCREKRSRINMLQCVGWTIGISATPLLAWAVGDWVTLSLATTLPSLIFLFIIKLMPESPRWLMAKGRPEEAHKILSEIATVNGRKLPTNSLSMLKQASERCGKEKVYGIPSLFSSKRLAGYTVLILICWGINSLAYYSLVLNVGNMSGNPFLNYFYQSLVELPAYIMAMWSTDRIGRRWTQSAFFILLAIACAVLVAVVLNPALSIVTVVFAVFAKFCVCITFYAVYLQSLETYPTCLRQTGTSTNSILANLIGIIGPYIVYLGTSVDARYPYVVLGTCSLVGIFTASFLPETLHAKLPETLAEAHNFGKGQRYWSFPKRSSPKTKPTITKTLA